MNHFFHHSILLSNEYDDYVSILLHKIHIICDLAKHYVLIIM
jgi:hypothetical protein